MQTEPGRVFELEQHTHTHTHSQGYSEDVSSRYHPPHPPVMSRERGGSQRSVTLSYGSPQVKVHEKGASTGVSSLHVMTATNPSILATSPYSNLTATIPPLEDQVNSHTHTHTNKQTNTHTHTHTGRKDRNRPERGSGRHQSSHYSSHSSSISPSIHLMMSSDVSGGSPLTNGFATIPRCIF